MNWEKLKLFYLVARERNITQAAGLLNITPSALSKQISSLENELGVKLFVRHQRGVELTYQGQKLFPDLEKVNTKLSYICTNLQSNEEIYKGVLRISSDFGFIDTWLGTRIPKFIKQYPLISLNIKAQNTPLDLVRDGCDIGITTHVVDSSFVKKQKLMSFQRKLYASPRYIEKNGFPRTVNDLDNHNLISFGEDSTFPEENMDWHLKIGRKGEMRKPYLTINTMRSLVDAAKSDIGIISFSEESPLLSDCDLVNVLPDIYGPTINLYIVYMKEIYELPMVKVFIDFILEEAGTSNGKNSK